MNPIAQAFHDADPNYVPKFKQQLAIDNPNSQEDPAEKIAEGIPQQIDSLREGLAANIGVDKEKILVSDVMGEVKAHKWLTGYAGNRNDTILNKLIPREAYDLGYRLGDESVDGLTAVYREVLGREPDPEGLAFWRGHYENGMPLSEVIRHIENSSEAKGLL